MANVKVLVVGGGGHGGAGDPDSNGGGGGGGGGYQYNASFAVTEKVYEVTVGGPGGSSVFDTITAIGGGPGGRANGNGSNGACGGGAGGRRSTSYAGLGGTGSNGGNGGNAGVPTSTLYNGGAGGGGNSANGENGETYYGGNGGAGILNSISGTPTYYCGGGGGGGVTPGSGGIGGGGNGNTGNGYPGTPNTGGGGGGSRFVQGGMGGSGIVIVRFTTTDFPSAAVSGTGNTLVEDGSETVATFITSGKLGLGGLTTIPTVTTQSATDVATTSFTGNGNITDTGGENCTRRGFCYKVGTSGDPTTSDSVAYDDGSFGTGAFTKSITGLSPNTSYRVRAYAVNSAGTSYGTTVQVTTLKAFKPRTMWF
jgi:hypothetical protein